MPFNLKGRHFLSMKDNTPEEIDFLLQLSIKLKQDKYRRPARKEPGWEEYRPDIRKAVDPHPLRFRGRLRRRRRPSRIPGQGRHPAWQKRNGQGHGPGTGAHVRRHPVPRLQARDRRGAGPVRRSTGLERPDRSLPPDPGPGRLHDRPGSQRASEGHPLRLRRATAATTWPIR